MGGVVFPLVSQARVTLGLRAELKVVSPPSCPVARASEVTGGVSNSISKTSPTDRDDAVTEEFMLDADGSFEPLERREVGSEMEEMFSYGSKRTYRFTRSRTNCLCERIEQFDCPTTDIHARNGALFVTFHTSDIEQLRSILTELRDQWTGVTVKQLLHETGEKDEYDLVLLDRSELTDRQREVMETAHEMGYFEHGRGSNAGEVADALDINTSTFSEHLRAAQRKLLKTILDD